MTDAALIDPTVEAVTADGEVRPQWQTIRRLNPIARPVALAAADSTCPCGADVLADEPIMCVGGQTVQELDGTRTVDLTGAEWRCQRCALGGGQ